jgi:flavin reductase (DIM6/NTAB) family NADH-FMN oxidoreductase RutF
MTADDFKTFFRQLASGVCVVTLWADGRLHGFTATSVTSVSMSPPTGLFCVAQQNNSHRFLHIGSSIGISILGRDQRHLSDCFAAKAGPDGYGHVETIRMACGVPALKGALGHLQGSVTDIITVGDHSIIIFLVEIAQASPGSTPILYYDQSYHFLVPI